MCVVSPPMLLIYPYWCHKPKVHTKAASIKGVLQDTAVHRTNGGEAAFASRACHINDVTILFLFIELDELRVALCTPKLGTVNELRRMSRVKHRIAGVDKFSKTFWKTSKIQKPKKKGDVKKLTQRGTQNFGLTCELHYYSWLAARCMSTDKHFCK